jgi:hypothetical protein
MTKAKMDASITSPPPTPTPVMLPNRLGDSDPLTAPYAAPLTKIKRHMLDDDTTTIP